MDVLQALSESALFKDLSPASRSSLAAVSFSRNVKKRDILFMEGDEGHSLYLLASGAVQLVKTSPGGAEVVLKTIQAGEVFAEVVLFESDKFPATAIAISDSQIILFPRREILRLLDTRSFRDDFIAMLLRKQRYLAERIYNLTACDVEQRFFNFLAEHYGNANPIQVSISKKDIAAAIGATPESLSRLILRLTNAGVIRWQGEWLEICKRSRAGRNIV